MSRYTKDAITQLRERIDLIEVMKGHIQLKRAGSTWKACCPFHEEKTPSLVIKVGDTHYHCFGCGAHGDAIQFLMQHVKMTFHDAVAHLAERFNVRLETVDGESQQGSNRQRLKEVLQKAAHFYHEVLLGAEGKMAREYLLARGISMEMSEAFGIGFAPPGGKLLRASGATLQELQEVGLVNRGRELFAERITFPLYDGMGNCIGFSARKIHETTFGGKYINTPETALFHKAKTLYGLHWCRKRLAKEKQVFVVEGQIDALRLIFYGFDCTVAALGTAFGAGHVEELVQLGVSKAVLLFDGDRAGRQAALKVGHLFQQRGVEVAVARLPEGRDPDQLVLQEGPVGIVKAVRAAVSYLAFMVQELSEGLVLNSPSDKQRLVDAVKERLREWHNAVMVHESQRQLAMMLRVPYELLDVQVAAPARAPRAKPRLGREAIDGDRVLEGDLLRWLVLCGESEPSLLEVCERNVKADAFAVPVARKLYTWLLQHRHFDPLQAAFDIDDTAYETFLDELLCRKINRERATVLLTETVQRLLQRNWMREREAIKEQIEQGGGPEAQLDLVRRFDTLARQQPKLVGA